MPIPTDLFYRRRVLNHRLFASRVTCAEVCRSHAQLTAAYGAILAYLHRSGEIPRRV